jgi:hypothetical protein
MIYLNDGIRSRLLSNFAAEHMTLDFRPDHVVAQGSAQCTREKIQQIIKRSGVLSPIVSEYRLNGNFAFTSVPYKIPNIFFRIASPYFHKEELQGLLADKQYSGPKVSYAALSWAGVNEVRRHVAPALSDCISKIVDRLSEDDLPILEIGSGFGYSLSERVAEKTIRTQPNKDECHLLSQSISDPIYRMNAQDLYSRLHEKGKAIPLFFALDVFDTMSPQERQACFSQIAQLQSPGDRIAIMLDTNPEYTATIQQLEDLHPGTVALPLLPFSIASTKLSFVLVPSEYVSRKPTGIEIADMISGEAIAALKAGGLSKTQIWLHQLQQKMNLPIVQLEDFYVQQVKKELAQAGYTAKAYYEASFVPEKSPGDVVFVPGSPPCDLGSQKDLNYKSVTDTFVIKSWAIHDPNLSSWLASKGLQMPPQFDEEYIAKLRAQGKKLLGAEVLVIEAKKNLRTNC